MNEYLKKVIFGFLYGAGGGAGLILTFSIYVYLIENIDFDLDVNEEHNWPSIEKVKTDIQRYWREGNNVYILASVKNNNEIEIDELIVDVEFYDNDGKPVDGAREYVDYDIRANSTELVKFKIENIVADFKDLKFELFEVN